MSQRLAMDGKACSIAGAALVTGFLALWHFRATGQLTANAVVAVAGFAFVCFAYGAAFIAVAANGLGRMRGVPIQFVSGFLVANSLLFALTLASPLAMGGNLLVLVVGACVLPLMTARRRMPDGVGEHADAWAELLCILAGGIAATAWCVDSQPLMRMEGDVAVFQAWQDLFIHVREISVFAQAHGIGTIQDIKAAGHTAPVYHFASYASPAAVSAVSGATALQVYSGFQLPVGILLTATSAYALIASIWGPWPGLAAAVAVAAGPDAYQQGFGNRYLSYNFLAQVNLGMLYGIACVALAWTFVLAGCARGRVVLVLIGYGFLCACLAYKAHIFVANAFLLLIYPCMFFRGLKTRRRIVLGLVFAGTFVVVVVLSQQFTRVPTMRLDGSGIGHYVTTLVRNYDDGQLKNLVEGFFAQRHKSTVTEGLAAAAMIAASTFGLWIAGVVFAGIGLARRGAQTAILGFPILVFANYLVMSLGLALDTRGVGAPDELVNRPLVWAYFAIVAWAAGGLYFLAFGSGLPKTRAARAALVVGVCLAAPAPFAFGRNLQTMPVWKGFSSYRDFNAVPVCLVRSADFIRKASVPGEIFQDSEGDPRVIVSAIAERQIFAGYSTFGGVTNEQRYRFDALARFKKMHTLGEITEFSSANGIAWYLLRPESETAWPAAFVNSAAYSCGGFRVIDFRYGQRR